MAHWASPESCALGHIVSSAPINPVPPLGQFAGYCLFKDLLPVHSYRMTHTVFCQDCHAVWQEVEAVPAHFNDQVTVE